MSHFLFDALVMNVEATRDHFSKRHVVVTYLRTKEEKTNTTLMSVKSMEREPGGD